MDGHNLDKPAVVPANMQEEQQEGQVREIELGIERVVSDLAVVNVSQMLVKSLS